MQLRYISKMKQVLLITITALVALVSTAHVGSARPVSAEPKPCATYEIEGTIKSGLDLVPDSVSDPATEPASEPGDQVLVRQAEVYLHLGGVALVRHQVFATFTSALNEMIDDPVLLVTNGEGRATVDVPPGAVNVAFMTESPGSGNCVNRPETGDEPVIVAVDVPVQPTIDGPIGGNQGITYDDIFDQIIGGEVAANNAQADLTLASEATSAPTELAHTGPISPGVLALTVIVLGTGIGLGLGRGRRLHGGLGKNPRVEIQW